MLAVAREQSAAHAVSLFSWTFWSISHAATAVYALVVIHDALLSAMMWCNTAGCIVIAALTVTKRQRYGWRRSESRVRSTAVKNKKGVRRDGTLRLFETVQPSK